MTKGITEWKCQKCGNKKHFCCDYCEHEKEEGGAK